MIHKGADCYEKSWDPGSDRRTQISYDQTNADSEDTTLLQLSVVHIRNEASVSMLALPIHSQSKLQE